MFDRGLLAAFQFDSMAIRAMAERLGKRPRGLAGMSLNISPTRKS